MDGKKRNAGPLAGGVSQAKRGKPGSEWEDSPSGFEEELSAMMDEAEMDGEEREGQAGHGVIPVGEWWRAAGGWRYHRPNRAHRFHDF